MLTQAVSPRRYLGATLTAAAARVILAVIVVAALGPAFAQTASVAPSSELQAGMESKVRAFLEEEIEFDKYVFSPGRFPSVHWKRPAEVESTVGRVALTAEFYDAAYQRVAEARTRGRYGAVVRGTTPGGFPVVRYVTLYCSDADMDDYGVDVPISVNAVPAFGIDESRWRSYRENLRRFSFGSLLTFPARNPDGAVFLAGLADLSLAGGRMETPRLRDRQWWVEFKRRQDGADHPHVPLPLPVIGGRSAVIQPETDAIPFPYRNNDIAQLRTICISWADSSREPMVALVLHKGRIVFHEAFGKDTDGRPLNLESVTWMASITKLLTGVLVMQFVDRGLLGLDVPLDRYLAELRSGGSSELTLRSCLTHTAGLSWTGEWASDWNPSVENQVAQAAPFLKPGRTFKYHRAGYALAGKVLERLTGRTAPSLFDELLFTPLGMRNSFADNTYGGLYATAHDLGLFAQMLLNRGAYGKRRFLSEKAWGDMLPRPLHLDDPGVKRSWGIGTSPFGGDGLSDSTFGHGAASGAILRIDPVNDLVVVIGRNHIGPDETQDRRNVSRFLQAVAAPLGRIRNRD